MTDYASRAINIATEGQLAFCKFLSANDTGLTGGHQAGIYISKPAIPILFDEPGVKGENKEKWVSIEWQDRIITNTRFIYYGQGTRNEYRITNFGKGFPFLRPEFTGSLFVLIKINSVEYKGYFLNLESEIEEFLDSFGITPAETNCLIDTAQITVDAREKKEMDIFLSELQTDFPSSDLMSATARRICEKVYHNSNLIRGNPDRMLLEWTNSEYRLFRYLEYARYTEQIVQGFTDVDTFLSVANQVLNRRKSRAGKSLEHHLEALFVGNDIQYTAQAVTEGNKKPDFIFPSEAAYHDPSFPTGKLASLAAKTTCKDRWRQVLNEADRLRDGYKYLCTLQQGISPAQMDEMESEKVRLVVPKSYIQTYPKDKQYRIWSITQFIDYIKQLEND